MNNLEVSRIYWDIYRTLRFLQSEVNAGVVSSVDIHKELNSVLRQLEVLRKKIDVL